jgi:hypothetical protein
MYVRSSDYPGAFVTVPSQVTRKAPWESMVDHSTLYPGPVQNASFLLLCVLGKYQPDVARNIGEGTSVLEMRPANPSTTEGRRRIPTHRLPKPSGPPELPRFMIIITFACILSLLSTTIAQLSLSTASLPLTLTLPPLNASKPAFDLQINPAAEVTSLYLTFSICALGSNTSIIPAVVVSTDLSNYDLGDDSDSDKSSGGIGKANRRGGGGDVWALAWDKGFANWTYVDEEGLMGPVGLRIGFAEGEEISDGNVVLQLGAAIDGKLIHLALAVKLKRRAFTRGSQILTLPRRYDFDPSTPLLSGLACCITVATYLSELHPSTRRIPNPCSTRIQPARPRPYCHSYYILTIESRTRLLGLRGQKRECLYWECRGPKHRGECYHRVVCRRERGRV